MAAPLRFLRRSRIPVPAEELFAWHLRPGAFERLCPPGDGTRIAARSGRIEDDTMRVQLSVPVLGPVRQTWHVRHEGYQPGRRFIDVMEKGPFPFWRHEHLVEPIGEHESELVDSIEYRLPLGAVGRRVGEPITLHRLDPMFDHRHAVTLDDLTTHRDLALPALTVVVEGGAGHPLGEQLVAFLLTGGHAVASDVEIAGLDAPRTFADPDATIILADGTVHVVGTTGRAEHAIGAAPDTTVEPRSVLRALAPLVG